MKKINYNIELYRTVLKGCFIIFITFIVYAPALHGDFIWDDDKYVSKNPLLTAPDGLRRIWFSKDAPSQYFPMTYTVFWVEHKLWGLNPTGYHIVNVSLHTINALLVWRLLYSLSIPGAWFASLIFALHPVHVESVAWITELKNVLSCMFFILSLLLWLRFIYHPQARPWKLYLFTMTMFMLALLSKTTTVMLPAVLFLVLWFRNGSVTWRDVKYVVPFVLLGLAMGLLTIWWERYQQGTIGEEFAFSIIYRILIASRSIWFYPLKLLLPTNLTFSYPRWDINPANPLQYGWIAGCIAIAAALYQCRNHFLGRGAIAAVVFYVANLLPLLGFISLYTFRFTFVADHYQYIASIGLIALFAAIYTYILEARIKSFRIRSLFFAIVFIPIGVLTWQQSHVYKDAETIWQDTLTKNPSSWMAHNNLGLLYQNRGLISKSLTHYNQALMIKTDAAEVHNNLGNVFAEIGNIKEAINHYKEAVRLKPTSYEYHSNLGMTLAKAGQINEAISHYKEALRLNPNSAEIYSNIGTAFIISGMIGEAILYYNEALKIDPNSAEIHYNLGLAYARLERYDIAILHYKRAINIRPNFDQARRSLENALAKLGKN